MSPYPFTQLKIITGSGCGFDSHGDCNHKDHGHSGCDQGTCSADGHTDHHNCSDDYGS